jgi:hypothetical protein
VNLEHQILGLILVTLLGCSGNRSKERQCGGPTRPPAVDESCPPGTKVVPKRCPLDSCRYCEKPDRTREGPFVTWYAESIHVEEMPDRNGHWNNHSRLVRGRLREAGWLKSGARDGIFVRWYRNGVKALEATYCDGVLQHDVRRWSEQGAPLDAGAGGSLLRDGDL